MQSPSPTAQTGEYDAQAIAREIVDVCVDRKALDVTLIEIGRVTTLAEYFVICTGTSDRQIGAIARAVRDAMKEQGIRLLAEEGLPQDGWVLLDYGQVIVHVFSPEQRAYYDLERRWHEAPTLLRIQ
ncbi:MAG TPA: ribosome silencing factor [Chloroflexota bacterium]|nr:ribosome silencing factor [Chloroflexota bacterium]